MTWRTGSGTRVSVVIPALNEECWIGQTVQQLIESRNRESLAVEVVVVDGGSSDRTLQAASSADIVIAEDPEAARTIAGGRNVGAKFSSGNILFFTDADIAIPDLRGVLTAVEDAFHDPRVAAVTMRLMPYPWDSRIRDRIAHVVMASAIRASLVLGPTLARGECLVIRASAFHAVGGFDSRIALGEDCDIFRRLRGVGRVRYLKGHTVYHSPRRFRSWGYVRVLRIFLVEFAYTRLFRRPRLRRWAEVR